jgi:NTP pyrophosphatase (non-canonical NTP hydrolase)
LLTIDQETLLNQICADTYAGNLRAGWWNDSSNPLIVPTKLALIHSEVSEAMAGDRQSLKDDKLPQHDMLAVELADVVIRVADLAGFLGVPLGTIIREKQEFNAKRSDHKPEVRQSAGGKKY